MTEKELREKVINIAKSYLGCKESDGSHRKIIDIYNSYTPLPVNYKVKYTDHWCAATVTTIGIKAGLSDIILRECSCQRMIELYKKAGRWVENDAYTPQKGDIIFYDWDDTGIGDNTGHSDHVGIVTEVNGTSLKIIEGNMNDAVGYRNIKINARYIRGYGIPNYASKATSKNANKDVNANSKIDTAKHFSESLAGTYKAITGLNLRAGAGKSKNIIAVINKGEKVTCYGYYNTFSGAKWYYVAYKDNKGKTYLGYASSKYLKK